jgi:hypothetical protein
MERKIGMGITPAGKRNTKHQTFNHRKRCSKSIYADWAEEIPET